MHMTSRAHSHTMHINMYISSYAHVATHTYIIYDPYLFITRPTVSSTSIAEQKK